MGTLSTVTIMESTLNVVKATTECLRSARDLLRDNLELVEANNSNMSETLATLMYIDDNQVIRNLGGVT